MGRGRIAEPGQIFGAVAESRSGKDEFREQERVSFAKFLAQGSKNKVNMKGGLNSLQEEEEEDEIASSSSSEFEFMHPAAGDLDRDPQRQSEGSDRFPADELFYNGKMLPLEPVSRMAMVKDLNTVLRRGRSAPPSPYFDHLSSPSSSSRHPSTTQKSSSYPPRGRGSRRFKDFFGGLKRSSNQNQIQQESKQQQQSGSGSSSGSSGSSFLKFFGRSSSSSSTSSSSSSSRSSHNHQHIYGESKSEQQLSQQNPNHHHQNHQILQQNPQQAHRIMKNRASSILSDYSRSAPNTPLHPRASSSSAPPSAAAVSSGFVPVLHVPACIAPARVSRFFSGSSSSASSSASHNKTIEVL